MENLLPIGSIVQVGNSDALVMITGYYPYAENDAYDYLGVFYPIGFRSTGKVFLMKEETITKVLFRGYETEASNRFLAGIAAMNEEYEKRQKTEQ